MSSIGRPFSYVWADPDKSTVGAGFRASQVQRNVRLEANALGGQVTWSPTGVGLSAAVA